METHCENGGENEDWGNLGGGTRETLVPTKLFQRAIKNKLIKNVHEEANNTLGFCFCFCVLCFTFLFLVIGKLRQH